MEQSKFTANVVANYLGRAWAILSIYIFIPIYISFLGIESYGVVGFFGTLTGIIALADFGLTTTFSRELAKPTQKNKGYRESLLKTLGLIYGVLVGFIVILFIFFSSYITSVWLHSESLPHELLSYSVQLMGMAGGLQLFASFFLGGLIGLEKQVTSNLLQFAWSLFRALGSIAVLSYSSTITAFLYWHILSNGLYLFFSWVLLKKSLNPKLGKIDFGIVQNHYSFASRMMLISLISSLNLQIDKLLVSKLLNVTYFGYYTIAATLAQAPIVLANPISNAILPRFTFLFAEKKTEKVWEIYNVAGFLISILIIPISCACAIFSKEVIYLWTQNSQIANTVDEVCRWLIFGSMFQALQIMPFNLSIAYGYIRPTIILAITFLVTISTSLHFLVPEHKLEGAAFAWLFTNIILTTPYILFINRKILPGVSRYYVIKSISTVLLPSLFILTCVRFIIDADSSLVLPAVGLGVLTAMTVSFVLFFQAPPKTIIKRIRLLLTKI